MTTCSDTLMQNGCEMTISASGSSRSKTESAPSLSDVTIRRRPRSSRNLRSPGSPETSHSSTFAGPQAIAPSKRTPG